MYWKQKYNSGDITDYLRTNGN